MKKTLLICALLIVASSTSFGISSTSTCTQQSSTGFCFKWEQNGTVQEQLASCFPQHATLKTQHGFKIMRDLQIGDQILGFSNGEEVYSKVTGWLHRKPNIFAQYLKLSYKSSFLVVSHKHNLAIEEDSYVFADQILSKPIFTLSNSQFQRSENILDRGLYAPKTTINNYFVYLNNGEEELKILAHNFAHIRNPQKYEIYVDGFVKVWQMFNGPHTQNDVHPAYSYLQKTFTLLQE